ncbi:hypothetical protein [Polaromonas sp.]|uniref:hypothetical protein n=1 Tax=Polaromonas sp. TaxID=1869339 RepID=UPI0032657C28
MPKWLFVLALAALLGACKEDEPLPNAAAPVADATFECPVPASLQGKVGNVFLDATKFAELSGAGPLAFQGSFMAYSVRLALPDGSSSSIDLDEPIRFSAQSQELHSGCERLEWKSLGNLTLFEYFHGVKNSHPAQQLMYSRGPTPNFKNLRTLFAGRVGTFYEGEGDRCLAGLVQTDGEVERWCYQSGKFHLTRKMLKASLAGSEYRFVCDFSGEGPLLVDSSIVKSGPNPTPLSPAESDQATAAFTDKCMNKKALLKAKTLDES